MQYGRVHWFRPDELSPAQREYYDGLLAGPRRRDSMVDGEGRLVGAFNARLLDPPVGTAIQQLGAALRFGTALSDREREIVILEVALAERAEYEWEAHCRAARRVGMTDEELAALFAGEALPDSSTSEQAVRAVTEALLYTGDLDDEQFDAAEATLGAQKIFGIVSLVGHYRHTALATRVWRVPPRDPDHRVFE